MILVDANLLLYAKIKTFPEHPQARAWLEDRLNGEHRVGLSWPSLLAFLRIATSARVFRCPMSSRDAWATVEGWLSVPVVWTPGPTERHAELLGEQLRATSAVAADVPDAHLAALTIAHGLVLCTRDRGFAKYPGLRWHDPLSAQGKG